jgi:hypothetical protein
MFVIYERSMHESMRRGIVDVADWELLTTGTRTVFFCEYCNHVKPYEAMFVSAKPYHHTHVHGGLYCCDCFPQDSMAFGCTPSVALVVRGCTSLAVRYRS